MFKYVCQNFKDGQVLTADCLNKMEEGIENACQTPGPQGEKGDDGVSVTHEWDGTTLKITSASGTSSVDLRGPTGPIGIKGNPGDAGKSAYEYARDGGYMGSETKFSEQLAGIPDWDKVKTYTANTNIVIAQQSLSSGMWMNRKQDIEPGIPYAVYIGGKEYFCIAGNEDGTIYLGNPKLFDSASTQAHNNEPFCITWAGGAATAGMFFKDATLSYPITLKVTGAAVTTENKLPEKYLPDGVAMKSDIPEGGGGANIDVVASVGQTIVVEEVDADGKPTKWKAAEYQERTHWSDFIEVQPSTTITPFYYEALGVPMGTMSNFDIAVGYKYKVIFDGVEYICEAFIASMAGMSAPAFGNTAVAGGANTGEPFAIFKMAGDEWTTAIFFDMNPHTVQVIAEKVTPIPQKYLENASPYYIEISGTGAQGSPYVCNDTTENVRNIYQSGRQLFVRNVASADGISMELYVPLVIITEENGVRSYNFLAQGQYSSTIYTFCMTEQEDGTFAIS